MGIDFDWKVDNEDDPHDESSDRRIQYLRWILSILVGLLLISACGWGLSRWRTEQWNKELAETERAVELYLDLEHQAIRSGAGDLFLATQSGESAWLAAQLQPHNQQLAWVDAEVVDVDRQAADVWATLRWTTTSESGEYEMSPVQRTIFFREEEGVLVRQASAAAFWGEWRVHEYSWGSLKLREADVIWHEQIAELVAESIALLCVQGCLEEHQPLDIIIHEHFDTSAIPQSIILPSPHIFALTDAGEPAPQWVELLRERMAAALLPASIRFAVPPELVNQHRRLAERFSEENSSIDIDIVSLEDLPDDPQEILTMVDGAFLLPTVETITAGLIHDLTDFSESDPNFDIDDFTSFAWQGSVWNERLWMLPQFSTYNIIYVNQSAYTLPEIEMTGPLENSPAALSASGSIRKQLARSQRDWLYVDGSNDLLFAQAIANRCDGDIPSNSQGDGLSKCIEPLRPGDLEAAFSWHQESILQVHTPDLSILSAAERSSYVRSLTTIPPRVAYWVGHPEAYRQYSGLINQRSELGIRSLSGDDENLMTPLWVYGYVISQETSNPKAVWAWINYLSRQRPVAGAGLLPARRSVTRDWALMPAPLRKVMQESLDASRTIRIEERNYLDWDAVRAVTTEQLTPTEAAQQQVKHRWFAVR